MATVVSRAQLRITARRRWSPLLVLIVAAVAVAVGAGLQDVPRAPAGLWLLAAPALVVAGYVVTRGPQWCVAALVALVVLGASTTGVSLGATDLRLIDVAYLALVTWVIIMRSREGRVAGNKVGQRELLLLLAVLFVSILPHAYPAPGAISDSLLAYLRLAQTLSLVWLVPYALRVPRDFEFILGSLGALLTFEVGRAIVDALLSGQGLGDPRFRLAGSNSENLTGLLAALLIVAALHSPVPRRWLLRGVMLTVGVTGLLMTRSLGSIVAAGLALAIFGFYSPKTREATHRQHLLLPARFIVIGLIAFVAITAVKGENLPQSGKFDSSSTLHRAVLATVGFELFTDNPILGVGFARAPQAVVASQALNDRLRQRFNVDVNPSFFPESGPPIQVHNAYVQILAEAGLVGLAVLIALAFGAARGVSAVLRRSRGQPRLHASARCALALLVVILFWWNDNGLYGAQPESVIAATLLGLLAAVPLATRATTRAPGRTEPAALMR